MHIKTQQAPGLTAGYFIQLTRCTRHATEFFRAPFRLLGSVFVHRPFIHRVSRKRQDTGHSLFAYRAYMLSCTLVNCFFYVGLELSRKKCPFHCDLSKIYLIEENRFTKLIDILPVCLFQILCTFKPTHQRIDCYNFYQFNPMHQAYNIILYGSFYAGWELSQCTGLSSEEATNITLQFSKNLNIYPQRQSENIQDSGHTCIYQTYCHVL